MASNLTQWENGKFLLETFPSASLTLSLILTLTLGFRVLLGETIPSISLNILIGLLIGKSLLGRQAFLGSHIILYDRLFSINNQVILGYIGCIGFLFVILICGLKINLTSKPKKGELVLGLIGPTLPFLVSIGIEHYLESTWNLEKEGFKGFGYLIYCFSFSSYPTNVLLLQDLNLFSSKFSNFLLSASLVSELSSDSVSIFLNFFYDKYSFKADSMNPILVLIGFICFVFLIFRPLINILAHSASYGQSRHVYILVLIATGISCLFISSYSVNVPVLVLGIAIPRLGRLVNLLSTQIQESVSLLLSLFIIVLSIPVNVFDINLKEKTTRLCAIIVLTTTVTKFLTYLTLTKVQTCCWRRAGIVAILKIPIGATELAVFSVLRQKKIISEGAYSLLIVSGLVVSSLVPFVRLLYRSWKLVDHPKLPKGKTVAVVVLDGWGEAKPDQYNCIHVAETPTMDSLKKGDPDKWRLVKAHGSAVGLPTEDDMGNSEVGHNTLGAGRIFAQGAKLVDLALESGKIYEGEGFKYISECFEKGTLHLIGLLSDGGVHSRLDQLLLLLKGAGEHGAKRIRVHVLTDGRDVLDGSSVGFVETLENYLAELREKGVDAQIASGGGRMYVTMDRYENDWEVVKRGWDAQVLGEAPFKFRNAVEAVKKLREAPKASDQYLPPFVIADESGKPVGPIVDGDAVVTINFRADRMVMAAKAFEYEDFDKFDRVRVPKIRYAGMLQYDGELKLPSHYLVSPPEIDRTSGEYLVHNGIRTFACSETVKFGHVTFFWNGNRSGYFNEELEEYVEIPSDSGITFNVKPKMKALEIGEKVRDAILSGKFDQVRVNIPNGDMVGHTGDIEATVVACKAADEAVKMILDAIEQVGGIYVVTADHGNAEDMVKRNKSGQPLLDKNGKIQILTSHTCEPVPIAIGGPGLAPGCRFRRDVPTGGLANVAATVMNLHGFEAPSDYEPTLVEVVDI